LNRTIYFAQSGQQPESTTGTWGLERIRILITDLPQLRREIVGEILSGHPDLEVISGDFEQELLPRMIELEQIDVLVLGRDDPALATALLRRAPQLRVIAVASHGQGSWLYELRPAPVPLGEVSPEKLLEVVRERPWSEAVPGS
jgi:DNA-binding NarL/FixJ family response regulator